MQAAGETLVLLGLYVPAAHGKHAPLDAPPLLGLYVPAAHGKHASREELPVDGL